LHLRSETRLEPFRNLSENTRSGDSDSAQNITLSDPDLARVLERWAGLSVAIRRAILALVENG
jgi:hypothetical protein